MKNLKLVYTIGAFIAAIFSVKYILGNIMKDDKIQSVLNDITSRYGKYIAQNVERIYRMETNNFKSNQFAKTYSAGMMAFGDEFPYGWKTLNEVFWLTNPQYRPVGTENFKENPGLYGDGGGVQTFVKFESFRDAAFTLAAFLEHYGNNPGRWFSTDPNRQAKYNKALGNYELLFT